jgi:GLPGLI family protein
MKKQILLFSLFLSIASLTQAQSVKEKPLIKAIYQFEHLHDTTTRYQPLKETMVLFAGPTSLLYGSYETDLIQQQLEAQIKSSSFDGSLVIRGSGSTSESYYFHFPSHLSQSIHTIRGKKYLVEEKFPVIDWEMTTESKQIKGFTCHAAKGHWGGRNYTAWFTTDVQVTGGPWKLQGLPGLILEAYDEQREVSFILDELETLQDQTKHIATDPTLIKASQKEIIRLREALTQQLTASAFGGTATVQGASVAIDGSEDILPLGGGKSNSANNSIDPSKIQSVRVERTAAPRREKLNNPLEKN